MTEPASAPRSTAACPLSKARPPKIGGPFGGAFEPSSHEEAMRSRLLFEPETHLENPAHPGRRQAPRFASHVSLARCFQASRCSRRLVPHQSTINRPSSVDTKTGQSRTLDRIWEHLHHDRELARRRARHPNSGFRPFFGRRPESGEADGYPGRVPRRPSVEQAANPTTR